MSDETLSRIEIALERVTRTQETICAEVARLSERVDRLAERRRSGPASREETLRFLDRFRAAEALGEASLGAWIAVSTTECLRGGLRTVQMREGSHARLLAERIKELGGAPRYEIDEATHANVMRDAGSRDKPDARKVLEFVQRNPDPDAAVKPILDFAARLDADPETQSLLRAIAQDERATLELLREACAALNPAA
jgi:hypothetical protein